MSSFQFVSGFSHTRILFDFLRFVFVFQLSGLRIYPLLGSLSSPFLSLSLFIFLSLPILSVYHNLWRGCFSHLSLVLLLCSLLLAGREQQTMFLFRCGLVGAMVYLDSGSLILWCSSVIVFTTPHYSKMLTRKQIGL